MKYAKKRKGNKKYDKQWQIDNSGYVICFWCGIKCDGELPKCCECEFYVDLDGEKKCKECHKLFSSQCKGFCNYYEE